MWVSVMPVPCPVVSTMALLSATIRVTVKMHLPQGLKTHYEQNCYPSTKARAVLYKCPVLPTRYICLLTMSNKDRVLLLTPRGTPLLLCTKITATTSHHAVVMNGNINILHSVNWLPLTEPSLIPYDPVAAAAATVSYVIVTSTLLVRLSVGRFRL